MFGNKLFMKLAKLKKVFKETWPKLVIFTVMLSIVVF